MPDAMPMLDGGEIWREVPEFPLYRVSNYGRVWSSPRERTAGGIIVQSEVIVAGRLIALQVGLYRGNKQFTRRVHRLVLEAFVGPRPTGLDGCHGDGRPKNNRLENLRWDTHAANMNDSVTHKTMSVGERHPSSYLSLDDVRCILAEPQFRGVVKMLAKAFGVHHPAISRIRSGKRWAKALEWAA